MFLSGFLAASLCIGVGAYFVAWRPLASHVGDLISGDVGVIGGIIGLVFWVVWSLVPIYAWLVLSILFFVGWLSHRTLQIDGVRPGKDIPPGSGGTSCGQAQAADDHVVRLPVPPRGITTLEVSLDEDAMAAAVENAREITRAKLRQLEFPSG